MLSSAAWKTPRGQANGTMENLELSLSSLATISRHVDKSHNELNQYLAKQVSGLLGAGGGCLVRADHQRVFMM